MAWFSYALETNKRFFLGNLSKNFDLNIVYKIIKYIYLSNHTYWYYISFCISLFQKYFNFSGVLKVLFHIAKVRVFQYLPVSLSLSLLNTDSLKNTLSNTHSLSNTHALSLYLSLSWYVTKSGYFTIFQ